MNKEVSINWITDTRDVIKDAIFINTYKLYRLQCIVDA